MLWMAGQCQACPSSSRSLHPNDMNKYPWKAANTMQAERRSICIARYVRVSPPIYYQPEIMHLFAPCSFVKYVQTSRTSVLAGLASIGHVRIKEALFRNWKVARSTELMEESLKLLDFLHSWEMIFTKLCSVCIASQPLQKARSMYNGCKEYIYILQKSQLLCIYIYYTNVYFKDLN